jgi:hypothetical protein
MRPLLFISMISVMVSIGCKASDDSHSGGDGDADGDTDSDTDTETDTDTDVDTDNDIDSDSDTDSDIDADADGDGDADSDSQTGSETDGTDDTDSQTDDISTDTDVIDPTMCLTRTEDEATCLDCCDCAVTDCSLRASCRDQCATYVFSSADDPIVFEVPTDEGESGEYFNCYVRGEEQACKDCCDCATIYACGDYKYCRDVCKAISN